MSPLRPAPLTVDRASMPEPASPVRRTLEHSLSIMTAATEGQLVSRTLAAAADVTGAGVAAAIEPDGTRWLHGEPGLARRLAMSAQRQGPGLRPGTSTGVFGGLGLPCAITVAFGDTLIIVATVSGFGPDAGSLLALVVAHAKAGRERLRELAQLARQADSDPLTGLRHHRPFEERLAAARVGRTAVLAVDVDQFKRINDEFGHQAGDIALVSVAGALRSVLRGEDELYRIGGDEFAVVIDVNGPAEVVTIARRLLEAARRVGHTISVGAALNLDGETGRETLTRADKALYQAKRAGRDNARLAA